jgi:SPP1 gp7 family putative phage head morphogenesis protein
MRGITYDRTLDELVRSVNRIIGDRTKAEAIVRTETVRATSRGLLEDFKDKGVKKARFIAITDLRMCEKCADLNGRIFTLERAKNVIPVHVNCRCSWTPLM